MSHVDLVPVAELPRISAASGAGWDPQRPLAFGAACLQWMQRAAAARPGQQLRFAYDGGSRAVRWETLPEGDLPSRLASALPLPEPGGAAGGSSGVTDQE